jgi:hypothetical protein
MARRNIPSGLVSVGFQKITTNSTATTLNTTCAAGSAFLISTEVQGARLTCDGSTPAASTGVLIIAANSPIFLDGVPGSLMKIARAASGAILNVQAFKHRGE